MYKIYQKLFYYTLFNLYHNFYQLFIRDLRKISQILKKELCDLISVAEIETYFHRGDG